MDSTSTGQQTFPQEIEVTLKLKFIVTDQEARDYYVNPVTNTVNLAFIADIFDVFNENFSEYPNTINKLTPEEVKKILGSAAGV
jgi:hypothetical protein